MELVPREIKLLKTVIAEYERTSVPYGCAEYAKKYINHLISLGYVVPQFAGESYENIYRLFPTALGNQHLKSLQE